MTRLQTGTHRGLSRAVAFALLLLLALSVLSSCGGSSSAAAKPTAVLDEDNQKIIDIANNLKTNAYAREYFAAAMNGYDITEYDLTSTEGRTKVNDDFNTLAQKTDEAGTPVPDENAVRKILLNSDASWSVRPTDAGETYLKIIDELTVTNMTAIQDRLKEEIALTPTSGAWDSILCAIGAGLRWVSDHMAFGNYILTLFIISLLLEIVLIPLGIKQQKNSIKQATLAPKVKAITKKYEGRNDQPTLQKKQQEIQELYQKENFNQFSGCLPLLIQLPIIWILYTVVINPLHYMLSLSTGLGTALNTFATTVKAAGGMGLSLNAKNGTIEILSKISEGGTGFIDSLRNFSYFTNAGACADTVAGVQNSLPNFNVGSVNFGLVPSFGEPWLLLIVPVLTFVVYYFSMRLTRKFTYQSPEAVEQQQAGGCSPKIMDIMMPLFSVYIAFIVPAVVGVYWIFKSILGTVKQFILAKVMPYPVFTEEEYRAAAKEYGGKAPKPVEKYNGATGNPRKRSLHHIDDEDFEDTREKAELRRKAEEDLEDYERPKAPVTPASTKEEIEKARLKLGKNEEAKARHKDDESASSDEDERKD